jgi:hypothetical protein
MNTVTLADVALLLANAPFGSKRVIPQRGQVGVSRGAPFGEVGFRLSAGTDSGGAGRPPGAPEGTPTRAPFRGMRSTHHLGVTARLAEPPALLLTVTFCGLVA